MTKQKRMVYIYEENLDFYESIENKSEFINAALKEGKQRASHVDANNIDYVKKKLAEIDEARRNRG